MLPIIIFDLECTTWEDAPARGWSGEDEYREIIQIGALKVDWPSGKIIDSLNVLVKPLLNPQLSEFVQQLTGIAQQAIDQEGIEFPLALEKFLGLCGSNKTYSYGPDALIIAENVALTKCHPGTLYTMDMPEFINIGPIIHRADPTALEQRVNSGRLWQHYNLPKPVGVGEHDALFDCYSILAALKFLHTNGKIIL